MFTCAVTMFVVSTLCSYSKLTSYVHNTSIFAAIQHFCDNTHDGGSWLLVRRVKQGSSWHPANDNLTGTEPAYGTYGSATFDGTFGIPYSYWLQSSTEFLFMTGMKYNDFLCTQNVCERLILT
jgi:hypothetical protein